jgi:hypothetical protein
MRVIVQPCTELVIQSKFMLIISLCIFFMKYQVQVAIASADQISFYLPCVSSSIKGRKLCRLNLEARYANPCPNQTH